jgi:protein-disulfide isomerase
MSNKREREKRREERLREESKADTGERRTRLLQFAAGAVFLAIAAVVVLIVVSSSDSGGDAGNLEGAAAVDNLVQGIPQRKLLLGDPTAKVELVEYGDLQCPVCKAYSEDFLPAIIENRVKNGGVKVDFRNFTIIGEQSTAAGAAAVAAGAQGRGWQFLELFYKNQGAENSGYADDEFLTAVAEGAGVKDIARWNRDRKAAKSTAEVERTTAEAERLELTGTPTFAIAGPNSDGFEILGTPSSPEELEAAIDRVS